MKIILITTSVFLTFLPQILSQSCSDIWALNSENGDSKQKINFLTNYIELACKDSLAEAYLYRGVILNEQDDSVSAYKDFRKAIEIKPTLAEGWYQLANLTYMHSNSDTTGIVFMNRAINLNAQRWKYFMLRGDFFIAVQDLNNGLNDYKKSLQLINDKNETENNNDLKLTYCAIGGTLLDMSQIEEYEANKTNLLFEAVENLHQAIRIDSFFDNAYFLLGNAYFYLNNYDNSIEAIKRCIEINPNHSLASFNLAIIYREAGKYFGEQKHDILIALEYLNKSYQLNQNDVETLRLLGIANGMSGEHENALKWFIKASELDPNNASVWWNLGMAYGLIGNEIDKEICIKTALRIDPDIEKK